MLNLPQNNLFVAPAKATSESSISNSDESSLLSQKGMVDSEEKSGGQLFANVISNVLEQNPEQLQQLASDIESLLADNPNLEAKIPKDLLINFLNSGGEDFKDLENFLESETGKEIDLSQMLAENLNQAMELYKNSGGDIQALNPNLAVNSQIEIELVNDADGQKLQFSDKKLTSSAAVDNAAQSSLKDQLKQDNSESSNTQQFNQQDGKNDNNQTKFSKIDSDTKANLIESNDANIIEAKKTFLDGGDNKILSNTEFGKQFTQQLAPKIEVATSADPMQALNNNLGSFKPASADSPILVRPLQIETPVGKGEWSKQFNDQVVWLGSQQFKAASIKLNPLDLGPVEINIKIVNDVASIQFNSHSVQVRELIEQALPRLRDQLGEQGIQLSDVDVQDGGEQQTMKNQKDADSHKNAQSSNNNFFKELDDDVSKQSLVSEVVKQVKVGLVDYFA